MFLFYLILLWHKRLQPRVPRDNKHDPPKQAINLPVNATAWVWTMYGADLKHLIKNGWGFQPFSNGITACTTVKNVARNSRFIRKLTHTLA